MADPQYPRGTCTNSCWAARDAAEELHILTRMGSRRTDPLLRWQRLVEALEPFATEGD